MMNLMEPPPPKKNKQTKTNNSGYITTFHCAFLPSDGVKGDWRLKIVFKMKDVFFHRMNKWTVFLNFSEVLFSYVSQFLLKELRFQW